MRKIILKFVAVVVLAFCMAIIIGILSNPNYQTACDNKIYFRDNRDVVFADSDGRFLWVEPNENGYYDYDKPPAVYWQDDVGRITEYLPKESEPNESEYYCVCGKTYKTRKELSKHMGTCERLPTPVEVPYENVEFNIIKRITEYIPTWPDYIEIEKTLIIETSDIFDDGIENNHGVIILSKGTKIYFKD